MTQHKSQLSHALDGYSTVSHTANYDKARTDYTVHIIDTIIDHTLMLYMELVANKKYHLKLIDIGSGTGKFTRALYNNITELQITHPYYSYPRHIDIIGVEPVESMRMKSIERAPYIPVINGTGDHIPLEDKSIDIVYCSQSYHWFATLSSLREIHRVLCNNGYLSLVWNTRNTAVPWVRKLDDIIDSYYPPDVPRQQNNSWRQSIDDAVAQHMYTPLQHIELINHIITYNTVDDIINTVLSISVIAKRSEHEKQICINRVKQLLSTHPATSGKLTFELPYRTDIYWCEKID